MIRTIASSDSNSRLNNWSAGLNLDLDPNKKQERNAYRSSIIAHERTTRDLDLDTDRVKLQVYDDARNLEQARRQYDISLLGVKLAQSRLEEQQLLMEIDRGTARDLVDAQNDLVDSQNDLTGALVNHTVSLPQFLAGYGDPLHQQRRQLGQKVE